MTDFSNVANPLTEEAAASADKSGSPPVIYNHALFKRVYALEQNSGGALAADVAQLQSDMTAVEGDVAALQADVSTLQSDMSTAQADISALQSGGGGGGSGLLQVGVVNIFQQPMNYVAGDLISYRDLSRSGAKEWQIGITNNTGDPFPGGVNLSKLQLKLALNDLPGTPGDYAIINSLIAQLWSDPEATVGSGPFQQFASDWPYITAALSNNLTEIYIYPADAAGGNVVYDSPSVHNVTFSDNLDYGFRYANFSAPPTVTTSSSNMAVFDLPYDFYSNLGELYIPLSFEPNTVSVEVFKKVYGAFKKIHTDLYCAYASNSETGQLYVSSDTTYASCESRSVSASVSIGTAETKAVLLPIDFANSWSNFSLGSVALHSVLGYVDSMLGSGGSLTINSIKLCEVSDSGTFSELYNYTFSPGDDLLGAEAAANKAKNWQINSTISVTVGRALFVRIEVTSAGLEASNNLMFSVKWDVVQDNCVARITATANNV